MVFHLCTKCRLKSTETTQITGLLWAFVANGTYIQILSCPVVVKRYSMHVSKGTEKQQIRWKIQFLWGPSVYNNISPPLSPFLSPSLSLSLPLSPPLSPFLSLPLSLSLSLSLSINAQCISIECVMEFVN